MQEKLVLTRPHQEARKVSCSSLGPGTRAKKLPPLLFQSGNWGGQDRSPFRPPPTTSAVVLSSTAGARLHQPRSPGFLQPTRAVHRDALSGGGGTVGPEAAASAPGPGQHIPYAPEAATVGRLSGLGLLCPWVGTLLHPGSVCMSKINCKLTEGFFSLRPLPRRQIQQAHSKLSRSGLWGLFPNEYLGGSLNPAGLYDFSTILPFTQITTSSDNNNL